MLTIERLRELLSYDPATGNFVRLIDRVRAKAGDVAGWRDGQGYINICIDDVVYKAHRLAWLYMTGSWPKLDIDHKDTVKSNNAWENLRQATKPQNMANCKKRASNTVGFKGVTFCKAKRRWRARISSEGRRIGLGYYRSPELAYDAYLAAAAKYHGEFAREA